MLFNCCLYLSVSLCISILVYFCCCDKISWQKMSWERKKLFNVQIWVIIYHYGEVIEVSVWGRSHLQSRSEIQMHKCLVLVSFLYSCIVQGPRTGTSATHIRARCFHSKKDNPDKLDSPSLGLLSADCRSCQTDN